MLLTMPLFILSDYGIVTTFHNTMSLTFTCSSDCYEKVKREEYLTFVMLLQSSFTHYLFDLTMIDDVRYYYF